MIASPSQGMKGQPQAGLAALAQPAQAPRGMPQKGIQQIMDSARKMSDAQLADVLSGKSMDVPQYVAMTEAMGRKSLRNAVQGQQAMAQAKQPSIKDKLLNEYKQEQMAAQMAQAPQMGGIAGIPAPNMESVDMASGGIISFDQGGTVTREQLQAEYDALQEAKGPWYMPTPKGSGAKEKEAAYKDMLKQYQATQGMVMPPAAPISDAAPAAATVPPPALSKEQIDTLNVKAPKAPVVGVGAGAGGANPYAIPSYESLQGKKSTDYLSKLADLTEKQRAGIGAIKKQGGGEALMQLASGILSRPTLAQGLGAALPLVASTSAATRKETQGQEQLANDYDLNMAKAQEAAEKGDMALALQYQQVANQAKAQSDTAAYQQGMLGIHQGRNAILGETGQLGKVQLGLANADKQALNEAKQRFPMVTKSNQAAYDAFIKQRSTELKMQNPLTKPYANLGGSDLGSSRFNTVQSLPKGAKIFDPFAED